MKRMTDDSEVLIAFARTAAKAQAIEALFQELLMAAEVAEDKHGRSFEEIAAKIESETLGRLKGRFMDITAGQVNDPNYTRMWKEINDSRIFLIHKFFSVFPIPLTEDHKKLAQKQLAHYDALFDIGFQLLRDVRDITFGQMNIPPDRLREFLAFVVKRRRELGI